MVRAWPAAASVALATCLLLSFARAEPEPLAADGRVGVVVDRQGLVVRRAASARRFTPVGARSLLFPGDRWRTGSRGAHALEARLKGGGRLTLGPGTLLDVTSDGAFVLLEGELEAHGTEAAPVLVRGLRQGQVSASAPRWLGADREGGLRSLPEAPRWLVGYRGTASEAWMGALLAHVDGREVPLRVTSYAAEVEIVDAVARTTIVQTFANESDARLEGTFRFPLPAEASLSGFGLWVGGELVEADLVERERARRIYEEVRRRRQDPGLLEWAGGNLFQARVFPIEPRAEKRVRLVYTEVLPLEGDTWRYRHALSGGAAQPAPLRELSITVRARSALPLAGLSCPTHPEARARLLGPGAAEVTLEARDVARTRDFEVAGRLAAHPPLTVLTHRRGDEAWFLLLLQPPDTAGAGGLDGASPEAPPLDLIVALDTSGSVDGAARGSTEAFLAALLAQLGPDDRVRVATFDTRLRWLAEAPRPPGPELEEQAARFLAARPSRGFTDLEGACAALRAAASPGTHVVLVTDGIATSADPDPQALAGRLRSAGFGPGVTVHAVAPGPAYEKPVLEALASVGAGSLRAVGDDPAATAQRLLAEATLPLLEDLRVEVTGVATARVYPSTLPPLPVGTQHSVLGRLDPRGAPAAGTVVVTGTLGGKPVRYTAPIPVPTAGEEASYLPRLWARRHLEHLLAQGPTAAVREDVIRLSLEHGLLTPYTSLLVLESDEDRARYGVQRGVRARDAELEFAATRDAVAREALAAATKEARAWRLGLRRRMQAEIDGLGRDLPLPASRGAAVGGVSASGFGFTSFGRSLFADADGDTFLTDRIPPFRGDELNLVPSNFTPPEDPLFGSEGEEALAASPEEPEEVEEGYDGGAEGQDDAGLSAGLPLQKSLPCCAPAPTLSEVAPEDDAGGKGPAPGDGAEPGLLDQATHGLEDAEDEGGRGPGGLELEELAPDEGEAFAPHPAGDLHAFGFPAPGPTRHVAPPEPEPPAGPEALRAELRRLLAPPASEGPEGAAWSCEQTVEALHPTSGRRLALERRRLVTGPGRWALRTERQGREPQALSVEGRAGLRLAVGRRLARAFDAGPRAELGPEAVRTLLGLPTLRQLEGAELREVGREGRLLTFTVHRPPTLVVETWVLDLARGFVAERRIASGSDLRGRAVFADPVERGGRVWPGRCEWFDAEGRLVLRATLEVAAPSPSQAASAATALLGDLGDVVLLGPALPTLAQARAALRRGQAGVAERLVLAAEGLERGERAAAMEHGEAALQALAGLPGAAWIEAELRARALDRPGLLAAGTGPLRAQVERAGAWAWPLARRLVGRLRGLLAPSDVLALAEALAPAVRRDGAADRGPQDAEAGAAWDGLRAELLEDAGRGGEADRLLEAAARGRPDDARALLAWAERVAERGDPDRAADLLRSATSPTATTPWSGAEHDRLAEDCAFRLLRRRRAAELAAHLRAWTNARPGSVRAWHAFLSQACAEGREAEADAWVAATLGAVGRGPTLPQAERARLKAALLLAFGDGWGIDEGWWAQRRDPRWQQPLADLAAALLAGGDEHVGALGWLLDDWRFQRSEAGKATLTRLRGLVLGPGVERSAWSLARWRGLTRALDPRPEALGEAEADALRDEWLRRLSTAATPGERGGWVELLARLFTSRDRRAEVLVALERQHDLEPASGRAAVLERWIEVALALPHDEALEGRALERLRRLGAGPAADPVEPARARVRLLRQLTDWAVKGRAERALGTPAERAGRTRAQARAAGREARRAARAAFAGRLGGLALAAGAVPEEGLESLCLSSENGTDLEAVLRGARLLAAPAPPEDDPRAAALTRHRRRRAGLLLAHAATRRGAGPALAEAALEHLAALPEGDDTDPAYQRARLLLALDRVDELRALLAAWCARPEPEPRWLRLAALLEAELGQVERAAAALEPLRGVEGALGAQDLAALARWLLVLGDEPRRQAVLGARYEAESAWRLAQLLGEESRRLGAEGTGLSLEPDLLPAVAALARKQPEEGSAIRALYLASKDPRVPVATLEALLGHTPLSLYPALDGLRGLLAAVHEEATLDGLRGGLAALAARARSETDRRALTLATALVESRATAARPDDPAPARRAATALGAALDPSAPGERAALASLLGSLLDALPAGAASGPPEARQPGLRRRRLELLGELSRGADVPSGERLAVERSRARALEADGERDGALERLEAAEREAAASGDPRARAGLAQVREERVRLLVAQGRFAAAETLLESARAAGATPLEAEAAQARLLGLFAQALARGAPSSLGQGAALARAGLARIEQVWREQPLLAEAAHQAHVALTAAARAARLGFEAAAERERFARERLPLLLTGSPEDRDEAIEREAAALEEQASPRAALAFLLDRAEAEAPFVRRVGEDVWSEHRWHLAHLRPKAGALEDLEPRLLALVARGLEAAILAGDGSSEPFWAADGEAFWAERADDLAAEALRLAELAPASPTRQQVVAEQLLHLGRWERAADLLAAAARRGALDASGEHLLTTVLLDHERFEEALPRIERRLEAAPDDAFAQRGQILALAGLGRRDQALAALGQHRVRAERSEGSETADRWAGLGRAAGEAGLHEQAAALLGDALARAGAEGREREVREWRHPLALSLSALGRVREAVEQAAVLRVGGRGAAHRPLAEPVEEGDLLEQVLLAATDLGAYEREHEAQVAAEGTDVPVLRRALVRVRWHRGQAADALRHLEALSALVPDDVEAARLRVALLDELGEAGRALEAAAALSRLSPETVEAWEDLARRFAAAGEADEAERALTGAVEARPLEPDGARLLARARAAQGRPAEAARWWRRVTATRPLEPEGRLEEARAWIAAGEPDRARGPLEELLAGTWPDEAGDVKRQAAGLLETLR